MKSLQGQLLVAVPHLPDLNFFRSVVLVLQHDDQGSAGLVLNRPTRLGIRDLWSDLEGDTAAAEGVIHFGGPVTGPLMALHDSLALAEAQIVPGVFLSIDRNNVNQLVAQDRHRLRVFSGYSGWGASQLDREVDAGGWLMADASADHVFDPPEDLWKAVCELIGHDIVWAGCGRPHVRMPADPQWN